MKKDHIIYALFTVVLAACLISCSLKTPTSPTVDTSMTAWVQSAANPGFSPRFCHVSLSYMDKLYVIGGRNNGSTFFGDVWSTMDGASWHTEISDAASITIGGRAYFDGVVFNPGSGLKMYIIAGASQSGPDYKNVLNSTDGTDWNIVTGNAAFGPRDLFSCAVYDGYIWLSAGRNGSNLNDVWRSVNGADWTLVTGNAAFSPRNSHKMLCYNNKLWVIGGYDTDYCKDVWYSTNGADWTLATNNAAFGGLGLPSGVVYDNKMVLLAGEDTSAPYNISRSIWSSTDGADWTLVTGNAAFGYRDGNSAAVFDNRIFVIGGANEVTAQNDVWKMQ